MIPAEFKRNFQNADMCLVEPKGMDSLYTNLQCTKLILSHHSPVTGSTPLSVTLSIAMSSVISRKKTLEGREADIMWKSVMIPVILSNRQRKKAAW